MFIPVLNQPLSSNLYYVIRRKRSHQGEPSIGSKEEDMGTCLCCNYAKDVKERPINLYDGNQQFEILKTRCGFRAKSNASDGFAPLFLRRNGWTLCTRTTHHYRLSEALGVNPSLRAKLPPFTFSSSSDLSKPVVVGKWYCPFMFVKEEGVSAKEQMKRSVFYEMSLERRSDKVFSKKNDENSNQVFVNVVVKTQVAGLGGGREEAVWEEGKLYEEYVMMWFKSLEKGERKVGLRMATTERMRWEEERTDWEGKKEKKQLRFERVDKFDGKSNEWENFEFYVMVQSFVLKKRMDGSLVLTYDFRHTNHFQCKLK